MSNLETDPRETFCPGTPGDRPAWTRLRTREVPLGGVRGTFVRRSLPHRDLPTVGAWCFLDHFGPTAAPLDVLPHPHIGLQTVTWPLSGRIHHRDSLGSDVVVRPGELNLMTAGNGVSHSELTSDLSDAAQPAPLHGLQLWVALPEASRNGPAGFEHHADLPVVERGPLSATVLVGTLEGHASPATAHTPLVGVDLTMRPGGSQLGLDPAFEHAVQVVEGSLEVDGEPLAEDTLGFLGSGRSGVELRAASGARAVLLGGEPFAEDLVMWWNFVGRAHAEVEQAREEWERSGARFGTVPGHGSDRIPAPRLPKVRLTPRRRRDR